MDSKILIVLLVGIIFLVGCCGLTGSNSSSTSGKSLMADVHFNYGSTGMMTATVINRNDFTWTNLSIVADDYYTCEYTPSSLNLLPNDSIIIYMCSDGQNIPLTSFSRLKITTDQDEQTYMPSR